MEIALLVLRARVPGDVIQEQAVLPYCEGLSGHESGLVVDSKSPSTIDEAVHRVKTYQLSHHSLDSCRKEVRMVSEDSQSRGLRGPGE